MRCGCPWGCTAPQSLQGCAARCSRANAAAWRPASMRSLSTTTPVISGVPLIQFVADFTFRPRAPANPRSQHEHAATLVVWRHDFAKGLPGALPKAGAQPRGELEEECHRGELALDGRPFGKGVWIDSPAGFSSLPCRAIFRPFPGMKEKTDLCALGEWCRKSAWTR